MKHLQKATILLCLAYGSFACGTTNQGNNAEIQFETTEIDFGEIEYNGNGECSFPFANPGNTPLVIQHVIPFHMRIYLPNNMV